MAKIERYLVVAAVLSGVVSVDASAGEAKSYTGSGTYTATRTLMPLASGAAAVHITNSIFATIEPTESGFMNGECAGLGHISAEGDYQSILYCTFDIVGGDEFDLRVETGLENGVVEIIGGNGVWTGASGSGTVHQRHAEGWTGSFDFEFHIVTP